MGKWEPYPQSPSPPVPQSPSHEHDSRQTPFSTPGPRRGTHRPGEPRPGAPARAGARAARRPGEKVNVIYAGVDLARFDAAKADGARVRREWGAAPGERLLVQVGAREWKGWKDLVRAAALLAADFPKLKTAVVACEDDAKKREVSAFA